MTKSRISKVSLNDYLENNSLNDLTIEGSFILNESRIGKTIREGSTIHVFLKGLPNWGVSHPKAVPETRIGIGYFHIHGDERVYVNTNIGELASIYDKIVPCFECGVAIKYDFPTKK